MSKPVRKVSAAGAAGAATVVVVWLLTMAGLSVSPEVSSALTTLAAFAIGYLTPAGE